MTEIDRHLGQRSSSLARQSGADLATLPNGGSPGSHFEPDALDLVAIWNILWARRLWVEGAAMIGIAIALATSLLQTPLYRSTAVLELNPPTVPILAGAGGNSDALQAPSTDYEFLPTQYGILKSKSLARRVVQDLNLGARGTSPGEKTGVAERIESETNRIAGGLTVQPVKQSRLVELTYVSTSAREAALVVNGFASAFLASTVERRFEATAAARDVLGKRLEATRNELNNSERKLVDYAKANRLIVTGSEGGEGGTSSLTDASLVSLNASLATAQQKRIAAEERFRQAGSITEVNQSTAALRQEKAKLETEYREKSTYLKDDYPDMVRLRSRLAAVTQAIQQEAGTASGSLRAEYQAALSEENALRAQVQQLSGAALNERGRSVQYNILKRELDTNRSIYDALLTRYNQVGVASDVGTPQAAIVDRGDVPGGAYSPNLAKNVVIGLLAGLIMGALAAIAYEVLTDTIKTPADVREKLRLPVLGIIPSKKRRENLPEVIADPKSPISEAYSALLATLQFTTNTGMPQTLFVTSARPAEGKSTTSFVVARTLAGLGRRVLLLDADMRKPSFIVEERADLGFSRLLTGNGRIEDHILRTRTDNLWLMPSGPVPPNPSQLLNSPHTGDIIAELRKQFDAVVIDGPPAQGFADAPLLGAICDGVLFVVESGKTRRRLALEVIAALKSADNLVLGVALTKYRSGNKAYGYGYQYYPNGDQSAPKLIPHELTPGLVGSARPDVTE